MHAGLPLQVRVEGLEPGAGQGPHGARVRSIRGGTGRGSEVGGSPDAVGEVGRADGKASATGARHVGDPGDRPAEEHPRLVPAHGQVRLIGIVAGVEGGVSEKDEDRPGVRPATPCGGNRRVRGPDNHRRDPECPVGGDVDGRDRGPGLIPVGAVVGHASGEDRCGIEAYRGVHQGPVVEGIA